MIMSRNDIKIVLVAMYSEKFAMVGETHGVSVLAGELIDKKIVKPQNLLVLDMYAYDQNARKENIIAEAISFKPNMIGFSCPYGSYDYLKAFYNKEVINKLRPNPMIVFGGALPTYIPEKYLSEIDEDAIVIRGEGEEAICCLAKSLISTTDYLTIDNISFCQSGIIVHNKRKQVDLASVAPPYRGHLPDLLKTNAQIFVENSRGCAWGKCNFCSRNIYLDDYKKTEYRRFPLERLKKDLITLTEHGVKTITFADEDFCGSGLNEMLDIVTLLQHLYNEKIKFVFDVSMNVNTIYNSCWSDCQVATSKDVLLKLKTLGLRKIFLGVESGSATQLKRYNKQHQPIEAIKAINILRELNIQIEIGYILFDPLCSLSEIKENIEYLQSNNLSEITSSLGSGLELRLHFATQYVVLLDRYFAQTGQELYERVFDNDTLNYPSFYADNNVSKICQFIRAANKNIRPLYYPLKSLSRYGENGALGTYSQYIKSLVVNIRECYIQQIKKYVFMFSEESISADVSATGILEDLEIAIVDLYYRNKTMLKRIINETDNKVLMSTVSEYDSLLASKTT